VEPGQESIVLIKTSYSGLDMRSSTKTRFKWKKDKNNYL